MVIMFGMLTLFAKVSEGLCKTENYRTEEEFTDS